MASQSLYRKWRSQTFSDLVGQAEIVQTLKNALATGSLSHAYLFTGPRGTGKTSTARLLAKTLNCTNRKGGEPCNECEQCREITAGNSFNVIEIDAASNRGIDSIRELREKVMVRPSTGKYKIYILDEAHMLTTEAFNALLKTLEEPPEHAIFVMATTDVEKMPATVISRCQPFYFKRITTLQIVKHLQFVAEQEQIELERGAAELIARAAAGGMRDALSLLDQAIAYCGHTITLTQIQTMLGVADPRAIQKFVTHIAHLDSASGLHLIHELAESGADLRQINTQVAEYWRAMMLVKAGANIATILDCTEDEVKEITQTAQFFALDELTDCARIFAQNDLMQKNQGTPQLGLELALLTAIERHRHTQSSQPVQSSRPETPSYPRTSASPAVTAPLPAQTPPVSRPAPVQTQPAPVVQTAKTERVADESDETAETSEMSGELPEWDTLSYADDEEEDETPSTFEQTKKTEPVAPSEVIPSPQAFSANTTPLKVSEPENDRNEGYVQQDIPSFTLIDVKEKWEQIKRRVKSKKEGVIASSVLNDFAVVAVQGTADDAVVVAQAAHAWHYSKMQQESSVKVVEWALKIELGQACRIKFLSPEQSVTLPSPPTISLPYTGVSPSTNGASSFESGSASSLSHKQAGPHSAMRQPEQSAKQQGQQGQQEQPSTTSSPTDYENGALSPTPLARMHTVRENTTSSPTRSNSDTFAETVHVEEPPDVKEALETLGTARREPVEVAQTPVASFVVDESRRALLERKAKADPVVQKVTEMFKANMKDVRPK